MRRTVISGAVLLLLILLVSIPAHTQTGSLAGKTICLDPGHGGSESGAINQTYDLREKDINLDVSYGLKALLVAGGAQVEMTRTDDSTKSNNDRYTFCNNVGATILVSIHTNSVTNQTVDGSLALYFQQDDRALAQAIYAVMYPALKATAPEPTNFTDFGLDRFASGVLMKSDMPAAMMEPLFMSHSGEAALLSTPIYLDQGVTPNPACSTTCRRAQIAQAIHEGIVAYFAAQQPTPTPEPGGAMHVSAIDMWYNQRGPNYIVYTRVTIVGANNSPVQGATVHVDTTLPDGSAVSDTGTTSADGSVTFSVRSQQAGAYTSRVTGVTKDGWQYDPAANVDTAESVTIP